MNDDERDRRRRTLAEDMEDLRAAWADLRSVAFDEAKRNLPGLVFTYLALVAVVVTVALLTDWW